MIWSLGPDAIILECRIIGIPEDGPAATSTANVSKLLREVFALIRESLVDRAKETLTPKPEAGEWPGDGDRLSALRGWRESGCFFFLFFVHSLFVFLSFFPFSWGISSVIFSLSV